MSGLKICKKVQRRKGNKKQNLKKIDKEKKERKNTNRRERDREGKRNQFMTDGKKKEEDIRK